MRWPGAPRDPLSHSCGWSCQGAARRWCPGRQRAGALAGATPELFRVLQPCENPFIEKRDRYRVCSQISMAVSVFEPEVIWVVPAVLGVIACSLLCIQQGEKGAALRQPVLRGDVLSRVERPVSYRDDYGRAADVSAVGRLHHRARSPLRTPVLAMQRSANRLRCGRPFLSYSAWLWGITLTGRLTAIGSGGRILPSLAKSCAISRLCGASRWVFSSSRIQGWGRKKRSSSSFFLTLRILVH